MPRRTLSHRNERPFYFSNNKKRTSKLENVIPTNSNKKSIGKHKVFERPKHKNSIDASRTSQISRLSARAEKVPKKIDSTPPCFKVSFCRENTAPQAQPSEYLAA